MFKKKQKNKQNPLRSALTVLLLVLLSSSVILCGILGGFVSFATDDWGGSGTEADPYTISSAGGLKKLSDNVIGGTNYSGKYFKLTSNIDLSGYSNWQPIG